MPVDLNPIHSFLPCKTPDTWVQNALSDIPSLLIDHANCEKKAASTAMNLLYRYVDKPELLQKMSRLAREELRHFEQVLDLMTERGVAYEHIAPSRYAGGLFAGARTHEPAKLIDTLIIGAFIEARSCERFACLVPFLDESLAGFYQSLLKSESRHFKDYLSLAQLYSDKPIDDRVVYFAELERDLIEQPDDIFRFHSGPVLQ